MTEPARPSPAVAPPVVHRDVVCPFCALGVDDLVIEARGAELRVVEGGCARTREGFERPPGDATPRVGGTPVSLEAAVARAAEILRGSRLPLVAGLGTDTGGARAALALAERVGGVVDHLGGDGLFANLLAMQAGGWVTGTVAEVRNRADLVLLVGTDAAGGVGRFFERVVWPPATLEPEVRAARRVVFLGDGLDPAMGIGPAGRPAEHVPCPPARLHEVVAVLRALVEGRRLEAATVAGVPLATLRDLADRLTNSRYAAIVWATGELPGRHRDLVVGTLAELLKGLNARTRAVGLPLAGPDNGVGVNNVAAWTTGVPLRTAFADGTPDYDPHAWSSAALLTSGAADALLWVTSFRDVPPPPTTVPTIVLARPGMPLDPPPVVAIPVGTPGLDHAGSVYRTDSVVALPLRQLRDSGLPTVAGVLDAIRSRLAAADA